MSSQYERRDIRASDMDREHVAERLRTAAGDGRLDFDELDERLEAAYKSTHVEPAVPAHGRSEVDPMPIGGRAISAPAVAIFGGAVRKGGWVVPRRFQAFALFGGVEIDLCEASLEDREITIIANAIFGGVDITVPEGVAVRTSGAGIMGGFDGPNDDGGAPDGPIIHVTGVALFGGVDVRRKPRATPKKSKRSKHLSQPPHLPGLPPTS